VAPRLHFLSFCSELSQQQHILQSFRTQEYV